jgi:general secretion pathway protein B
MSYILDALRKSEKERKRGQPPGIAESQEYSTPPGKKRSFMTYVILGLLCVNAAVLVFWLAPWKKHEENALVRHQPENTVTAETAETIAPGSLPPKTDIPEDGTKNGLSSPEPSARKAPAENEVSPAKKRTAGAKSMTHIIAPPAPVASTLDPVQEEPLPTPPRTQPVQAHEDHTMPAPVNPSEPVPAPDKTRIYTLRELPASIQQELPPFTISVSLYSDDPASRMIKINNQTLREGESLAEGLTLQEIRQDAVIFSYKDYRVRIGLQ